MRALSIAASGMQAQQLNVDVISHNIANMNTTAYKRQRAEFQDMLYQNMERPGLDVLRLRARFCRWAFRSASAYAQTR